MWSVDIFSRCTHPDWRRNPMSKGFSLSQIPTTKWFISLFHVARQTLLCLTVLWIAYPFLCNNLNLINPFNRNLWNLENMNPDPRFSTLFFHHIFFSSFFHHISFFLSFFSHFLFLFTISQNLDCWKIRNWLGNLTNTPKC